MKSFAVWIKSALFAIAMTGCVSASLAAPLREINFRMEWIPSGMYAPFYLAVNSGDFTKVGLKVNMLSGNGGFAAIDEVTAGHADMGMASCGGLAIAISKGRAVVSVGQYIERSTWAFFVPADGNIHTFKDLAGKTVVVSPNSSEVMLLPAILQYAGLQPDALLKIAVDPSQKVATYGRRQVDVVVTSAPFGGPLINEVRPSRMLKWADAGYVMPDFCIFARKQTVKDDPQMIKAFLQGISQGIRDAVRNPDAAVDATVKDNPFVKRQEVAEQWKLTTQFLTTSANSQCPIGWHPASEWKEGLATLKKYVGIDGDVSDLSRFYTNQFFDSCQ